MSGVGCTFCDHRNPPEAGFCNDCGAMLPRRCRPARPVPDEQDASLQDAFGPASHAGPFAAIEPSFAPIDPQRWADLESELAAIESSLAGSRQPTFRSGPAEARLPQAPVVVAASHAPVELASTSEAPADRSARATTTAAVGPTTGATHTKTPTTPIGALDVLPGGPGGPGVSGVPGVPAGQTDAAGASTGLTVAATVPMSPAAMATQSSTGAKADVRSFPAGPADSVALPGSRLGARLLGAAPRMSGSPIASLRRLGRWTAAAVLAGAAGWSVYGLDRSGAALDLGRAMPSPTAPAATTGVLQPPRPTTEALPAVASGDRAASAHDPALRGRPQVQDVPGVQDVRSAQDVSGVQGVRSAQDVSGAQGIRGAQDVAGVQGVQEVADARDVPSLQDGPALRSGANRPGDEPAARLAPASGVRATRESGSAPAAAATLAPAGAITVARDVDGKPFGQGARSGGQVARQATVASVMADRPQPRAAGRPSMPTGRSTGSNIAPDLDVPAKARSCTDRIAALGLCQLPNDAASGLR